MQDSRIGHLNLASRLNVEHVHWKHEPGERSGKYLPVRHHRAFDQALFPLCRFDNRTGCQHLAYPDRSQKSGLGGAKDNVRVIDRQHRRIISQTEGESAVNQSSFISSHFLTGQ